MTPLWPDSGNARQILGMCSGTSADGVDLALLRVQGCGLRRQIECLASATLPFEPGVSQEVARALDWSLPDLARWHGKLGREFARCAAEFLQAHRVDAAELSCVGSHGQTVFHHDGVADQGSVQIGDPAIIAEELGVPVVADFRSADRAAGGQGAPVSPFADWVLHAEAGKQQAILNLGGIANLTLLDGEAAPRAWDCGPANGPLDGLARAAGQGSCDQDGALALQGSVLPELLAELRQDSFFARKLPRSTGLERFGRALAGRMVAAAPDAEWPDLQRTACALAAWAVADSLAIALSTPAGEISLPISLCGGGIHNPALVAELRAALPDCAFQSYRDLGGDPDAREAVAFGLLADAFLLEEAASWPSTTGVRRPARLGNWTPAPSRPSI